MNQKQYKLRWTLLPFEVLEECIKVLEFGAKKYSTNSWQTVNNARVEYLNAALRHISFYAKELDPSMKDKESGIHPLIHAITDLMFVVWHDLRMVSQDDNF